MIRKRKYCVTVRKTKQSNMDRRFCISNTNFLIISYFQTFFHILIRSFIVYWIICHKIYLRMNEALDQNIPLPISLEHNIIYYMGPSPAREGRPIGSAGPTTASRMDKYTPRLLVYMQTFYCIFGS